MPALTWGVFGLLAGGLKSLAIWAVIGAVCGGLYAYYTEHLLTKNELKRLGGRLPVDSSAIAAYVRGTDPSGSSRPPPPSSPRPPARRIAADLSAQAYAVRRPGGRARPTPAGAPPRRPDQDAD